MPAGVRRALHSYASAAPVAARRSRANVSAIPLFAAAIILASTIMSPRLILEIGIFNAELMRSIAGPLAAYSFWRFHVPETAEIPSVASNSPFSLKPTVSFALIFALTLVATRLATTYLGAAWLPLVAIVSGLTDADAIAFSIGNLQRSGLVSLEWASLNPVLGALSNTFMKLSLVFMLANRALFRQLLWSFLGIGAVGLLIMLLYYDLDIFD